MGLGKQARSVIAMIGATRMVWPTVPGDSRTYEPPGSRVVPFGVYETTLGERIRLTTSTEGTGQ